MNLNLPGDNGLYLVSRKHLEQVRDQLSPAAAKDAARAAEEIARREQDNQAA